MRSHNPGRNQNLDERLHIDVQQEQGIQKRALFEVKNSCNPPVRQKSQADKDAGENQESPAGSQPAGVQEYLLISGYPSFPLASNSEKVATGECLGLSSGERSALQQVPLTVPAAGSIYTHLASTGRTERTRSVGCRPYQTGVHSACCMTRAPKGYTLIRKGDYRGAGTILLHTASQSQRRNKPRYRAV